MLDKTQHFIARANVVHNNKYDYSKTVYVGSQKKLTVTCPIHGDFSITPNNHLSSKQGCQKCSKRHHYTQAEFIQLAHSIHYGKYDYSLVQYVNNKIKVDIICPVHGVFSQLPATHTCKKGGCRRCASEQYSGQYHKKDTNWFVTTATTIHGDKYDYSSVEYHRYHDKVKIICPEHGPFFQTAGSHIHNKNGCPACSVKDYEGGYGKKRFEHHPELKTKPAVLYVIKARNDTERFIKVGITQKSVKDRFEINNRLPYSYEVVGTITGMLYDLFLIEQSTKKQLKQFKYKPLIKFNGHTECFIEEAQHDLLDFVGINTTLETTK